MTHILKKTKRSIKKYEDEKRIRLQQISHENDLWVVLYVCMDDENDAFLNTPICTIGH